MHPGLREMQGRGIPFTGFLYAGLMILPDGEIKVLEFNVRLGDPETQVIMRRLDSDLARVLDMLLVSEPLPDVLHWTNQSAVCLVLASAGYPQGSSRGDLIVGIEAAEEDPDCLVFHAGTALDNGGLVTAGGRVLGVTACADTQEQAREKAYAAAEKISFEGQQLRPDIAK